VILLGSAATAIPLAEAIVLARLGDGRNISQNGYLWLWNIGLSFDIEDGCRDGCYQTSRCDHVLIFSVCAFAGFPFGWLKLMKGY